MSSSNSNLLSFPKSGAAMAPSQSLAEAIPDRLPGALPAFEEVGRAVEPNGRGDGRLDGSIDQHALLQAMQAVRLGDFSVRLPGDQTGLSGTSQSPSTPSSCSLHCGCGSIASWGG
jgi:hypothetical protein